MQSSAVEVKVAPEGIIVSGSDVLHSDGVLNVLAEDSSVSSDRESDTETGVCDQ